MCKTTYRFSVASQRGDDENQITEQVGVTVEKSDDNNNNINNNNNNN